MPKKSPNANSTSQVTEVVIPFRKPAASAIMNQPESSSQPKMARVVHPNSSPPDRNGIVNDPMLPELPGDEVTDPPWVSTNSSLAMNLATPGAIRLMATPATMWLTPKVVVATLISRPPSMPPMMPPSRAIHGPNSHPHQPAKIVPITIMPSRPMLMVPLRSAMRPARPASAIGAAVRSATPKVPLEVRSPLSAMMRAVDMTATPTITMAAAATPMGLLRPSRARPRPVKPSMVGKASPYLRNVGSASRNGSPIIPATAPDMNRVISTIRFGLTPADRAASGFMPDSLSS